VRREGIGECARVVVDGPDGIGNDLRQPGNRSRSLDNGDGQRPDAVYPTVDHILERITAGQSALVSRYVTLCLLPVGTAPPWLVT
jgi:hypothetical protein